MATRQWNLVLTESADADLDAILIWSRENFGPRQADAYYERILDALEALNADPYRPSSKDRDEGAGAGFRSLHVGRRSRHLLLYRIEGSDVVILRILHDSMDIARHLPKEE